MYFPGLYPPAEQRGGHDVDRVLLSHTWKQRRQNHQWMQYSAEIVFVKKCLQHFGETGAEKLPEMLGYCSIP